jgi:hypothetical protein
MVGQGVLNEALADQHVEVILTVGRRRTGIEHPKLREIVRADLFDLEPMAADLTGYDACLFCLGLSSVVILGLGPDLAGQFLRGRMKELEYRRLTHDLTLSVARMLLRLNPGMTFCFVSGEGTDSGGRTMWARVKGQTEDDLMALDFRRAYMFRPGFIRPMKGVHSRTRLYHVLYVLLRWAFPLLKALAPDFVTTSQTVGQAMLRVARDGYSQPILATKDMNAVGAPTSG